MTGDNSGLESLSICVTKLSVSTIVRNGHTFDLRRLTWLFQKFCCKDLDAIAQMQLRNWTNWYHKRSGSVTLPYGFLQQTANKKRWSAKTHMKPLNFWCTSLLFQNKHPFPTFQNLQTCPLRSHSLPHLHGHRCAEAFRRAVKDDGACTTCRKGRQGGHVDIYESKIGELRKADMQREQNLRCSKHRVGYESKVLSRTYGKEIIKQSLLFLNFIIFHLFILCSPCLKFKTHPACLQQLPGQKASNFEKLMTCLVSTIHSIKFHQNKNPIEIPLFLHPLCCFFVSFSLCVLLTLFWVASFLDGCFELCSSAEVHETSEQMFFLSIGMVECFWFCWFLYVSTWCLLQWYKYHPFHKTCFHFTKHHQFWKLLRTNPGRHQEIRKLWIKLPNKNHSNITNYVLTLVGLSHSKAPKLLHPNIVVELLVAL